MSDPAFVITSEVAVNLITELFKTSLHGLKATEDWIKEKNKERDPFGLAARKYTRRIEERYNSMRIFGMSRPVPLRSIYTRVNILNKITARHHTTIKELELFLTVIARVLVTYKRIKMGLKLSTKIVNSLC